MSLSGLIRPCRVSRTVSKSKAINSRVQPKDLWPDTLSTAAGIKPVSRVSSSPQDHTTPKKCPPDYQVRTRVATVEGCRVTKGILLRTAACASAPRFSPPITSMRSAREALSKYSSNRSLLEALDKRMYTQRSPL
ncbi:hypothetical protein NDU88_006128 [Pleurodeles waltl]|uniref:Uncharacterized protein n=1 Tax=Pleurodeles waltl TaxID=8319 RepID=A0AAV7UK37_PLEWA|nr:hypothetical protein NDU88_006128 [Pleurodeles waltl]